MSRTLSRRLRALESQRQQAGGFAAFNAAIAERPGCPHTAARAYVALMRTPTLATRPANIDPQQAAAIYREVMV